MCAEPLRHLLAMPEELPGVELQMLSSKAGVHAGLDSAFTVFRFGVGDPLVVVEPEGGPARRERACQASSAGRELARTYEVIDSTRLAT